MGVLELDEAQILKKERLHPGKMLLVDTQKGMVLNDEDVKEFYAGALPTESGWTATLSGWGSCMYPMSGCLPWKLRNAPAF